MFVSQAIAADFKTSPYIHQLREFEQSCELEERALLWQMRTGKTKITVDTACHLYLAGFIDLVLVFAPNGVHENWLEREVPIHHWDIPRTTWAWRTDLKNDEAYRDAFEETLRTKDLRWYAFASETMIRDDVRKLVRRLVNRGKRRILVIFDESHDFGKPGSKRTKMARAIIKKCDYRRILTGTALDNSPLRAFSQFELLRPEALGFRTFEMFEERYAHYVMEKTRDGRNYPRLDSFRNLEELRERMARYSSVLLRSDCEDLPSLIESAREIDMTEQQLKAYRDLHKQFTIELEDGTEVSVGENTSRLIKLQQVGSGFIKDEYGRTFNIPGGNPRLDAVVQETYLTPGKVIIWCAFHEDMDRVAAELRKQGHKVVEYHGRVSNSDKAEVRKLMAPGAENDVKAMVGYPTAGLDLSGAGKIIWYSHTFDAIKRTQADERATAIGGENVPVEDFIANPTDLYIRDTVKQKVTVGDMLTREGMKEVLRRVKI